MKEVILTVLAILGIFIALPLLILLLRDKIFNSPRTKEQMDQYLHQFRERLGNPTFCALEQHYACALPDSLKQLYAK